MWWLRGLDLNQRPSGYEPDELPDCSTPRHRFASGRTVRRDEKAAARFAPAAAFETVNGFVPDARPLQCLATTYSSSA